MSDGAALAASLKSLEFVESNDKNAWLGLFDENALVADPVGVSPLDPAGEGHSGIKAIEAFWDNIIGPGNVRGIVRASREAGDSVANELTLLNSLPDGTEIKVDNVTVYTVNEEGKIVSLNAYWDYRAVQTELEAALAKTKS